MSVTIIYRISSGECITALLSNTGSQFNAEGTKLIGDHGEILTEPGKAITRAAVAAVRAGLTNRSVRGAVTGALAASVAGYSRDDVPLRADNIKREFCILVFRKKQHLNNGSQ